MLIHHHNNYPKVDPHQKSIDVDQARQRSLFQSPWCNSPSNLAVRALNACQYSTVCFLLDTTLAHSLSLYIFIHAALASLYRKQQMKGIS